MTAPRGRPQSHKLTEHILEATAQLLTEGGLSAATTNAITRQAGVGKGALYRRWPHLDDLLLDALLKATASSLDVPAGTPPLKALELHVHELAALLATPAVAAPLRGLTARAQHDPALGKRFRERWIAPRRHVARELLHAAIETGTIPPTDTPDAIIDLLIAPLYFRLLYAERPLTPDDATHRAHTVLMALGRGDTKECGDDEKRDITTVSSPSQSSDA